MIVRWLVRIVLLIVVGAGLVALGARWHDGPIGPLPGGPLVSGTLVSEPVADWSFADDVQEIELQLESQSRSRTTWILVQGSKAYIPASTTFPPGKTWHQHALEDGRATLRISDQRYPVTLVKVEDDAVISAVRDVASRKYPELPAGEAWLFEVRSRSGG